MRTKRHSYFIVFWPLAFPFRLDALDIEPVDVPKTSVFPDLRRWSTGVLSSGACTDIDPEPDLDPNKNEESTAGPRETPSVKRPWAGLGRTSDDTIRNRSCCCCGCSWSEWRWGWFSYSTICSCCCCFPFEAHQEEDQDWVDEVAAAAGLASRWISALGVHIPLGFVATKALL